MAGLGSADSGVDRVVQHDARVQGQEPSGRSDAAG